jgi:phage/plasmid-associated DNA primase
MSKKTVDVDYLKSFVTATNLNIDIMYGVSVNFFTQSKLAMASNSSMRFISDEGIQRRGAEVELTNQFVEASDANPAKGMYAIEKVKELFDNDTYKNALVFLLLIKTKKYYEEGLKIPKQYKNNFKDVCEENDKTKSFVEDYYIRTNNNNDLVSKHEILSNFNNFYNSKFDWKYLSDALKRLKIVYDKDKRCNGMKGCLRGLREKTDEEREHDDPVVEVIKPEIKP